MTDRMAAAENAFSLAVVSHTHLCCPLLHGARCKPLVCAASAATRIIKTCAITNIIHGKALQWELSPDTFRIEAQKLYPDAGMLLAKLMDKDMRCRIAAVCCRCEQRW
jgi:hypothetical protein